MEDCDGLKTGFIRAAGFCVTATAKRNGTRLISVVMGSKSKYGRFNLAQKIMEQEFKRIASTEENNEKHLAHSTEKMNH